MTLDPTPNPLDHLTLPGPRDSRALITKTETFTYRTLDAAVGSLAGTLADLVPEPGARVATWLSKTIEACLIPLAAARAGLVHVPINPALKRAQVAHILADAQASLLLTSAARAATLTPEDRPETCRLWLDTDATTARRTATPLPPSTHDPQSLAALLYTSGSTGHPKGVMLTHANLWLGAVSVAHYLALTPEDRTLALLPLGFDYGQNQLLSTWYAGGTVVPLDFLTPNDAMRQLDAHAITTLAAVPPLWLQLVEHNAPPATRVRRVTNSGGALTPTLIARLAARFPNADIWPMYGLTEAFRSTCLPPELVRTHPTSIGRAVPFAEVLGVRPDGRETAPGEPGELVHAGPLVAQGYWRDPTRTAARFRPAPAWSRSGGAAVWSGDTVVRDADGLFHFQGRDDELIKTSGHRVSPLEVEDAALASGTVAEAIAHAVPDPRLGQAIRLVVRGPGPAEALTAWLRRELPQHMQPREIVWRDTLPRNANGKLDRAAIRAEPAP